MLLVCNLASILQEKKKTITEVSKETNISRTTLTALSSNKSSGIQFETIDVLCSFLDIKPGDLFLYSSLDIDVCKFEPDASSIHYLGNSVLYSEVISFRLSRKWSEKKWVERGSTISLSANINAKFDASSNTLAVDMALSNTGNEDISPLQDLPSMFLSVLEKEITFQHSTVSFPLDKIRIGKDNTKPEKLKYSFHWPSEISK